MPEKEEAAEGRWCWRGSVGTYDSKRGKVMKGTVTEMRTVPEQIMGTHACVFVDWVRTLCAYLHLLHLYVG